MFKTKLERYITLNYTIIHTFIIYELNLQPLDNRPAYIPLKIQTISYLNKCLKTYVKQRMTMFKLHTESEPWL